jgi:hypothetical protein
MRREIVLRRQMDSAEGLFFDGGRIWRIRVEKPCPKKKVSDAFFIVYLGKKTLLCIFGKEKKNNFRNKMIYC